MLLIVNPDSLTCLVCSVQLADAERDEDHGDPFLIDTNLTFEFGAEEDAMIARIDAMRGNERRAALIAANAAWADEQFISACLEELKEIDAQEAVIEQELVVTIDVFHEPACVPSIETIRKVQAEFEEEMLLRYTYRRPKLRVPTAAEREAEARAEARRLKRLDTSWKRTARTARHQYQRHYAA